MSSTQKAESEQQALNRLAKGTIELINLDDVDIDDDEVQTWPDNTEGYFESLYHKRILGRLSHSNLDSITDGTIIVEFASTTDFNPVTFFEDIDINTVTNIKKTLIGATVGETSDWWCADFDIESMDIYGRVKVVNEAGAAKVYNLNVRGKVS